MHEFNNAIPEIIEIEIFNRKELVCNNKPIEKASKEKRVMLETNALEEHKNLIQDLTKLAQPSQNPIFIFLASLLLALLFVVIPNESPLFYSLVRLEWWNFLYLYSFIEIQAISLPDVTDIVYLSAFLFGFLAAPATHLLAYMVDFQYSINSVASTLIMVIVIYGYDGFTKGEQRNSVIDTLKSTITGSYESGNSATSIMHHSIAAHSGLSAIFYGSHKTKECNEKVKDAAETTENKIQTTEIQNKQIVKIQNRGELCDLFDVVLASDQLQFIDGSPLENNSENSPLRNAWYTLTYQRLKSHNRQNNAHYLRKGNWIMNALQRAEDDEIDGTSLEVPWSCIKRLGLHIAVHIFPRYYYQKWNIENGIIIGDRRYLWFYSSLFNLIWVAYCTFLQYFTIAFASDVAANTSQQVVLFIFFTIVGCAVRTAMKRISLTIDRMKTESVSMYFVGELLYLFIYFSFYRALFESISSWQLFSIIQVLHLSSEWVLYPLRASKYFYDFIDGLDEDRGCNRILRNLINTKGLNRKDWISFIALDFGIRCCILFASALCIVIILVTISFLPWTLNELKLSQSQLQLTIAFIIVSVVLEAINAYAIRRLFFQSNNINIRFLVKQCFANIRFSFLSCLLAAIAFINAIYAFTTGNVFRHTADSITFEA